MPADLKHPPQPPPQQWRVNLHARSRNFSVEVRATTPIPTRRPPGHHRVSILLRLWSFVLRLRSDCEAEPPRQRRRSLGSRFLGALKRIRGLRAKKRALAPREPDKAEIGILRPSLVPVLISASFLLGAISAHRLDKIGAAVAAAAPMVVRPSMEFLARQASFALVMVVVVLLGLLTVVRSWSRALDLAKHVDHAGDWARAILWKIWRIAAS